MPLGKDRFERVIIELGWREFRVGLERV